ncbi:LrgB family protein [Priestia flexa]|uniref:LrgB family protein n=1 Tax=Priestia flexa TaxID=86664 RepID=UPI00099B27D4
MRSSCCSLAYPLYNHRYTLKKSVWPILVGTITGLISGMVSGFIFAKIFDIERILILSIIPKSITAPVAIEITAELGDSFNDGFICNNCRINCVIFGPFILKLFRINTPLSKGISLGSASHVLEYQKPLNMGN